MARGASRHPLTIYRFMLDRWWPATLLTGIMLLVLAGGLGRLPVSLPMHNFMGVPEWKLWILAGAGGIAIIFSLGLVILGRNAHVQTFEDHLRLSTPFLRLNIAYRRILHITTCELRQFYAPKRLGKMQKEMLRPLAGRMVVVLDLTAWPIPRSTLKYFLSPIFFPADKSTRLALLVPDWIKLSSELESSRGSFNDRQHQPDFENPRSRLLSELKRSKK